MFPQGWRHTPNPPDTHTSDWKFRLLHPVSSLSLGNGRQWWLWCGTGTHYSSQTLPSRTQPPLTAEDGDVGKCNVCLERRNRFGVLGYSLPYGPIAQASGNSQATKMILNGNNLQIKDSLNLERRPVWAQTQRWPDANTCMSFLEIYGHAPSFFSCHQPNCWHLYSVKCDHLRARLQIPKLPEDPKETGSRLFLNGTPLRCSPHTHAIENTGGFIVAHRCWPGHSSGGFYKQHFRKH